MLLQNLFLFVLFFPLFSGLIILFFGNKIGLHKIIFLYYFMYTMSVLFLSIQLIYFLKTQAIVEIKLFDIFVFENFYVNFSFLFEILTVIMMFVVVFISFLVSVFSVWYMKGDPNHLKFLNFLNFFTFFMLLLVSSNNLIIIFIGWEGIGMFSYLLINFWSTRLNANRSALKAVLVNKIGDCFIYLFMFIYFFIFDSFSLHDCKSLILSNSFDNLLLFNFKLCSFLAFLLVIAAMAKSAQIFFHIWLPDAMEGPTPVSALLHAATMVTAGAYILIKFNWIILNNQNLFFFIALIGVLTNLISSLIAIFQYDIKKIIAYSTASQIGIIFIAIGVVKPNLALFHIFNHAFFKALLFILAGILIHYLNNNQDLRFMFEIKNNLFFVYISFFIASLTLAGLPFLSSYFSKEFIIQNSFLNFYLTKDFIIYFLNFSVLTTIIYTLKIFTFVFSNQNKKTFLHEDEWFFNKKNKKFEYPSIHYLIDKTFDISVICYILAFLSIFSGFLFFIIFNFDLLINSTFYSNLDLEKSINISFIEHSTLIIFASMCFSIFFYPKFLNLSIYFLFFYNKYFFFKNFFETKLLFESFFFYLSKIFYGTRVFSKIVDKGLIENILVSYWKTMFSDISKFTDKIVANPINIIMIFFWIVFDIILFIMFPHFYLFIFNNFFFVFILWLLFWFNPKK